MEDMIGYEGKYKISRSGKIWSCRKQRWLKSWIYGGYHQVHIGKGIFVHRLICKQFVDNPEHKPYVNHINGNKLDNRADNLEWCTQSENMLHANRTGLVPAYFNKGVHNGHSMLTPEIVLSMRAASAVLNQDEKKEQYKLWAERYGVVQQTIRRVVNGKTAWAWLK